LEEKIIVQTRDGGLHLVDVESKRALKSIRRTPLALWTCDWRDQNRIYLAGEGHSILTVDVHSSVASSVAMEQVSHGREFYTKRLISLTGGRGCLLGRTDGILLWLRDDELLGMLQMGGPVRDLCEGPHETAFVALEDGRVLGVDLCRFVVSMQFVSPINEPIWSLAFNGRETLAIGERGGRLRMLSALTLEQISEHTKLVRPKRMKWQTQDRLLFGWSDQLRALSLTDGSEELVIDSVGNTIEDFILCPEFGYVAFISYMRNIYLARLLTGEILCKVPDGVDYSKGLAWVRTPSAVHDSGAPEFITFGRHGVLNRYKIMNEKILPCGSIPLPTALEAAE